MWTISLPEVSVPEPELSVLPVSNARSCLVTKQQKILPGAQSLPLRLWRDTNMQIIAASWPKSLNTELFIIVSDTC